MIREIYLNKDVIFLKRMLASICGTVDKVALLFPPHFKEGNKL